MSRSSTMPWLTDSQLYLHSQGDVVHVWKCKKSSSVTMPMKPNDFDDHGKVTNHLDLVLHYIKWDETKYKAMVKYISERRFLVNCEGLVIAELFKFGQDGKIDLNVDPIYIRSHDVLHLDTFINCFSEQPPVPFRAVQYLEVDPAMNDSKGPQEESSSNSTTHHRTPKLEGDVNIKLSAELATLMNEKRVLEKRNHDIEEAARRFTADLAAQANKIVDLESKNKTLTINIMKMTEDQTTQTNKVTGLECKIKTLEGNATLMISVLAMQSNKIVYLESKNKTLKGNAMKTNADLSTQTNKVVDLELKNKTLEDNVTKATRRWIWLRGTIQFLI